LKHPVTLDGRYFVVRGGLWHRANPALEAAERAQSFDSWWRPVGQSDRGRDKTGVGERGAVWWKDGSPNLNRHLAKNIASP
jgi:hypothetical protein